MPVMLGAASGRRRLGLSGRKAFPRRTPWPSTWHRPHYRPSPPPRRAHEASRMPAARRCAPRQEARQRRFVRQGKCSRSQHGRRSAPRSPQRGPADRRMCNGSHPTSGPGSADRRGKLGCQQGRHLRLRHAAVGEAREADRTAETQTERANVHRDLCRTFAVRSNRLVRIHVQASEYLGVPDGIRTRVTAVKGQIRRSRLFECVIHHMSADVRPRPGSFA